MADGVSTQTQSRTPRRPGKGHNGAPSAADLQDDLDVADRRAKGKRTLEIGLYILEKLVEVADDTGDAKDYNFAGQQFARFYAALDMPLIEKAEVADRIEAAERNLHGEKPSRRSKRAKDIEAQIAKPPSEARH